ncbi:MAG: hypothetical protein R2791_00880 [Saprospiraceae bacterium]
MKYKRLFLFGVFLFMQIVIWGQSNDPQIDAIERHYQYLENESRVIREGMQKENESYRQFIQDERKEHQNFLQNTYATAGIIVSIVLGFLTFFGWNTFDNINKSRREIEKVATNQLLDYTKSLNEVQQKIFRARQNLIEKENQYQEYINYYRNADPKNGRFLFIGSKSKLKQMSQNELIRFVQVFGITEQLDSVEISKSNFYPASYDVIIYRSEADEEGQDTVLERLTEELRSFQNIPIVVYATNRNEWLKGNTEKKFNDHKLVHLANNQISLIDNVASAYRVAKMLPKLISPT